MAHFQKETNDTRLKEKTRLNPSVSKVSLLHWLAGYVGAGYLHFVSKTSFVHEWNDPAVLELRREKKPLIYGFWHNSQAYLAYSHGGEGVSIIVSRSKDGEYIAQVMKRLGSNAVRGSTSRGGEQALRDLCELLKEGRQVGFTPDGPRGPVQTVQGGIVMAAQMSGAPIIPLTFLSTRCLVFNSWDKFMLPLPFGSIVVSQGKPLYIDKELSMDQAKEKVRQAMNHNVEEAEERMKTIPSWGGSLAGVLLTYMYTGLSLLLIPLTFPLLMLRFGGGRTFRFLGERLKPSLPELRSKKRLWLHAASVGEWQALRPVLNLLKKNDNIQFVITVSTPEARVLVEREEPSALVRLLSVDLPWVISSWIKRISPTAVGVVETELWPRMLFTLQKNRIPVFLINGRLSKRSYERWRLVKPFSLKILNTFSRLFVRTERDGRHFIQLGAPLSRVHITGNTKMDNLKPSPPTSEYLEKKRESRQRLFGGTDGTLVVAGSTWSGEESALMSLFSQKGENKIRLILAPRRLERVPEVTRLFQGFPTSWSLWSKVKESHVWDTDILLVDTLGDLKELIHVADLCFVGGSLKPHGGQNPLEPAAAGVPVLFGPSMENFHEEAADLKRVGAARQARHEKDVVNDILELVSDEYLRRTMGLAGASYVESKQGSSQRTAMEINGIFEK